MRASIEILTDGSELTEPAIFLTIRRRSNVNIKLSTQDDSDDDSDDELYYQQLDGNGNTDEDSIDEGTIVSRYNLSGLTSLTGRISSDQSYKLLHGGAFRAVLIPSLFGASHLLNNNDDNDSKDEVYNVRGASLCGLPSLFLSLIQSGYKVAHPTISHPTISAAQSNAGNSSDSAPELDDNHTSSCSGGYGDISIIGPSGVGNMIDGILDTMFGHVRRRPAIRVCEVPTTEGSNWWEVYQDTYVKIWGQSVLHTSYTGPSSCLCKDCLQKIKGDENVSSSASSDSYEEENNKGRDRNSDTISTGEYSIVYIVLLLPQNIKNGTARKSRPYSFAIMPETPMQIQKCNKCGTNVRQQQNSTSCWQSFRHLPQEIVADQKGSSSLFDFILHYNPSVEKNGSYKKDSELSNEPSSSKRQRTEATTESTGSVRLKVPLYSIYVPSWAVTSKLTNYHLITSPQHTAIDEGVLIRAQNRAKQLNRVFPFAFPLSPNQSNHSEQSQSIYDEPHQTMAFGLKSCTSVILNGYCSSDKSNAKQQPFTFVSRIDSIYKRCKDDTSSQIDGDESASSKPDSDYESAIQSLKCTFHGGSCFCGKCNDSLKVQPDDNEIDLDSGSEHSHASDGTGCKEECTKETLPQSSMDASSYHILMLGTGCATPSPIRGSSAYGILAPTVLNGNATLVLVALIECGEGTLTGLLRHLPSLHNDNSGTNKLFSLEAQLSYVNFIWISHAHLDHYGDVPIVVQAIVNAKQKYNCIQELVVIAPPKVLKYLKIMFKEFGGIDANGAPHINYIGVTHRDLQYSPFGQQMLPLVTDYKLPLPTNHQRIYTGSDYYRPFAYLRNVEVEHCRDAFGLILSMNVQKNPLFNPPLYTTESSFILCFSGDTRPSMQLVNACQSYSSPTQRVNLLIHEGTFLHDTQGQKDAARKRHSTTMEALDVSKRMNAEFCILTHFSQRYKHVSVKDAALGGLSSHGLCNNWGIAQDGMMIPLTTNRALSRLNQLSECVDKIII